MPPLSDPFCVRLATTSDVEGMASLLETLFEQEAEFEFDKGAHVSGLTQILTCSDAGRLIVSERGGKLIGMVNLLYTVSTALGGRVAILEDMVVSEQARGGGVGQQLLEFAINQCQEDGCRRITLLTDHDNAGAHQFYERCGFVRSTMVPFRKLLSDKHFA